MADERSALLRSRRILLLCGIASFLAAAVLPLPSRSALQSWRGIALDISVAVVTIAAIWLGMLFGVALDRARQGSGGGATELVRHLMRPLYAGGLTLLSILVLTLASPYLEKVSLGGIWNQIALRGEVLVYLILSSGALYALLLALAPVAHILGLLRSLEAEADATPPAAKVFVDTTTASREPWRQ
jgi:hypothetical protein